MVVSEKMKHTVNQKTVDFFIKREPVLFCLKLRPPGIYDNIADCQKGMAAYGQAVFCFQAPAPIPRLFYIVLRKRKHIRCSVDAPEVAVELSHVPVADKKNAQLQKRVSGEERSFKMSKRPPQRPLYFPGIYFYPPLIVPYCYFHFLALTNPPL